MTRIFNDITETVGNTPLVRLNRTAREFGAVAEVLLKLEFFNPLSSVKDRIGLAMIQAALASGAVGPNTLLIEPTSGNTGIALAFVAAAMGLNLVLTLPENMSNERKKLLKILGAKVVLTPASEGTRGAVEKAEELHRDFPDSILLQQFSNVANPMTHRRTTAEEIWRDTDGAADILVAGVGTGGTISGVAEMIKKLKPGFRAVAVEPAKSPVLAGGKPGAHQLQGLGAGFVPHNLNAAVIDEIIGVHEEDAGPMARMVNRMDGIPIGMSSGAIVWAALQVARRPENQGRQIVAIVPSRCERYLSTWLFDDINIESDRIAIPGAMSSPTTRSDSQRGSRPSIARQGFAGKQNAY